MAFVTHSLCSPAIMATKLAKLHMRYDF
jgi:hypothetical protein